MTRGDALVERGATGLQRLSRRVAASGGLASRLAPELAEDAAFLRKLKPSLIAARAHGRLPTDGKPAEPPTAPGGPQAAPRRGSGPNPWVVIGVAFVAGVAVAKVIDWRSHAHPRG